MRLFLVVCFGCSVFVSFDSTGSSLLSNESLIHDRYMLATAIAGKGLSAVDFEYFSKKADEFIGLCGKLEKLDSYDRKTVSVLKDQVIFLKKAVNSIKELKESDCSISKITENGSSILSMADLERASNYYPWELGHLVEELKKMKSTY